MKYLFLALCFISTTAFALNAEKLASGNYLVRGENSQALYLTPAEYDLLIQEEKNAEHNRQVLAERAQQEAVARIAELEAIKTEQVNAIIDIVVDDTTY